MIFKKDGVVVLRGPDSDINQVAADMGIDPSGLSAHPETSAEKAAEVSAAKLTGIEFEGKMCSATGEDQAGLVAVWSEYKGYMLNKAVLLPMAISQAVAGKSELEKSLADATAAKKPPIQEQIDLAQAGIDGIQNKLDSLVCPVVYFTFENGSKLLIGEDNIEALEAVWKPFRLSFFPAPAEA